MGFLYFIQYFCFYHISITTQKRQGVGDCVNPPMYKKEGNAPTISKLFLAPNQTAQLWVIAIMATSK